MPDHDKIHALPCWNGSVTIAPLSGGLSNTNYLVTDTNGKHVVRFGRDYPFHHVSREREVMVARAAHAAGFAPEVEYAVRGVMVSAYVNAHTFSTQDVKLNAKRIAQLIRNFHTTMAAHISGTASMFWVFHVIRDYAQTLQNAHSPHTHFLPEFLAAARALEQAQQPLPIIFGHHDLLPANFLDDGEKLWMIDFEYAGFGTAMFDLAGLSSNALMDEDAKECLLEAYFGAKPQAKILQSFAAMECASLLRETMWAMVSRQFLTAPGVDYEAYTQENLSRYLGALDAYQKQYGKINP